MNNEDAMEYLHDLADYYIDALPLADTTKRDLRTACNLGISALTTIEDMKGENNDTH